MHRVLLNECYLIGTTSGAFSTNLLVTNNVILIWNSHTCRIAEDSSRNVWKIHLKLGNSNWREKPLVIPSEHVTKPKDSNKTDAKALTKQNAGKVKRYIASVCRSFAFNTSDSLFAFLSNDTAVQPDDALTDQVRFRDPFVMVRQTLPVQKFLA